MIFKKINNYNIEETYQNIVNISRSKFFYLDLELDDTFETRFDLIIFHAFIIFNYYKQKKIKSNFPQDLFDFMFNDFENNLREMGFGDIAVNKKMKIFIKAFYGRISQYNEGITYFNDHQDKTLLSKTILNNIYKGKKVKNSHIIDFTNYFIKNLNNFCNKTEIQNYDDCFSFLKFN